MAENQADMDLSNFEELFSSPTVVNSVRTASKNAFEASADFWRVPFESKHLTPKMKELILLALHAVASALNVRAINRHIVRSLEAGASRDDVLDVLLTIVGVANHALYFSVPILMEELAAAGKACQPSATIDPRLEQAKQEFVEVRGFWNSDRDVLVGLMPDYFRALTKLSVEHWKSGTLMPKEREFICIAIDSSVTHTYAPGLRIHIRNALSHGATRDELLEIFQLTALMGLEGYVIGAEALFGKQSI